MQLSVDRCLFRLIGQVRNVSATLTYSTVTTACEKKFFNNGRATPLQPIPVDISDRLKTLHNDVVDVLLEQSEFEGQNSFCESPLNLSTNLEEMAKYYFLQGGKLFRPTISLLMSSACNQSVAESMGKATAGIDLNQYRIAMISEMIHAASLVHDDVIDESDTRRGKPTANARWGNRQAVLVGDFILSRATKLLCSIGHPKVISTMAEIVEDLVKGELMQMTCPTSLNAVERFQHYMLRSFYKSASLFANSCKSVAIISGGDECLQKDTFEFGRHLGLAFQLIDDILDYVSSTAVLGKPAASDLKQGLATCPVLFAAKQYPELNQLISRRFAQSGDVENGYEIVLNSNGLEQTRELAKQHCDAAVAIVKKLPNGNLVRDCLIEILVNQLERDH